MYHLDDTIAALASAPGGAARGIVRLAGPAVPAILSTCFRAADDAGLPATRAAVVAGAVTIGRTRRRELPVDLYYWPNARSYTRQIAAELHAIGSPPLLAALLAEVCAAGARLAEPGEFTLRAFLAGRIDLTQAEAVLSVIDARGERELQFALAHLAGGLARPLSELRESLLGLLADLEAGLDFVEEDIEFVTRPQIAAQLAAAVAQVAALRAQLDARNAGERAPRVVLLGWPNVGKSSLFNALCGSTALVSPTPGTTRDYLIGALSLDDADCQLIDTAGYEPSGQGGAIATAAQQLAESQADACDVELLCLDATRRLNAWERDRLANPRSARVVVATKCDRSPVGDVPPEAINTSSATGAGLDELRRQLARTLATVRTGTAAASAAQRAAESLDAAYASLEQARELNAAASGEEWVAAELRLALLHLGKVAGTVYTDDILDRIFSRFCIGK